MNIRRATGADIDALVDVYLSVAHQEPYRDYCYPKRHEFPHDMAYWTRRRFEAYFDMKTADFVIMVAATTIPSTAEARSTHDALDSHAGDVPVALAVWNLTNITKKNPINDEIAKQEEDEGATAPPSSTAIPEGKCCRRDANLARMDAFRSAINEARGRLFDGVYGTEKIHLQILATRPEYQRRGLASGLVRWGLALAGQYQFVVTIFATDMGKVLYRVLGFEEVENLTIRAEGDDDDASMGLTAMVWKPGR